MAKEKHIVRASAEEIEAMLARGEGKTDWNRVRGISQEEAERLANEDDGPLSEDWVAAVEIGIPGRKEGVHIDLDADVLTWFRSAGPGYQNRINAVLRAFVQSRQRRGREQAKSA